MQGANAEKRVEMVVRRKISDPTAFTVLVTLQRMGFDVEEVERMNYYSFFVTGSAEDFASSIKKADILVNFNTQKAETFLNGLTLERGSSYVLVQDKDKPLRLLETLRSRLGFAGIEDVDAGVIWRLSFAEGKDDASAEKAARDLLHNRHFQAFRLL